MDIQETKINYKSTKTLVLTNMILLILANIIVYWTWYKVVFVDQGDTMFIGLFLITLFLVSIYYIVLLNWGVRLLKNMANSDKNIIQQSIILLIMNVAPMASIYIATT